MLKTIRICLYMLSLGLFFIAVLWFAGDASVENAIETSRHMQATFDIAHDFVEEFRATHHRLPTADEFENWKQSQSDELYELGGLYYSTTMFPNEVLESFGRPPPGAYLFELWRGEWYEYDPSWSSESTLIFDKSPYFCLGSALADSAVIASMGAAVLFVARRVRKRAA